EIVPVDVVGPPTSLDVRAAVWAELTALRLSATAEPRPVVRRGGANAAAEGRPDGAGHVTGSCGEPRDEGVLRSYCVGAAPMASGVVRAGGLAVADDGRVGDLTIRSFGVLRAVDTPPIDIELFARSGPPVNGSDVVFAAVAGAVWRHQGFPPVWPTRARLR